MNFKYKILFVLSVFFLFTIGCNNGNVINNNNTNNNNNGNNINSMLEFNECLAEKGIVIYGSEWCPACQSLVETLGGYDKVKSVYVECNTNPQRCANEAKTEYIPEIQFNGEVYKGQKTIQALSSLTNCPMPE
jgi:thiol-disulfide isomerase/thioredoxin